MARLSRRQASPMSKTAKDLEEAQLFLYIIVYTSIVYYTSVVCNAVYTYMLLFNMNPRR